MKFFAFAICFLIAVPLIGRALDHELARASASKGDNSLLVRSGSAGSSTSAGGIGTAAVYRDGLTKEFGDGLLKVGGRGPEAWRYEFVKEKRRSGRLQRKLTVRVLQVRSLRRVVGRSFIPSYWVAIASCESGVSWGYNGSSGFDGAIQFHPGTWSANRLSGYPAYAYQATPFQQLVVGEIVLSRGGWSQWPACSRKLGLR